MLISMDNHLGNLWVGNGPENTAIGMLTHNMSPIIKDIQDGGLSGQKAYDAITKYQGFRQYTQQLLADPILRTVIGMRNTREVVSFLKQVRLNAQLDPPPGTTTINMARYQDIRGRLERLSNFPAHFDEQKVIDIYNDFMAL